MAMMHLVGTRGRGYRQSPMMRYNGMTIAEAIRAARKELKMSQATLAENCGMSRTSITNIEEGRQVPPVETFIRIAYGLGYSAWELMRFMEGE